jgi:YjbR protein
MGARGTTFARVRRYCLSFEGTSERPSHGHPAFFAGKRAFAMCMDDFHDDGRRAVWCAAPEGMQGAMVETDAEAYFVPPYVGHRGWLGVRLDRGLDWNDIAGAIEDAYAEVSGKR